MDLNNLLGNQYAHGIKKFIYEILKDRYGNHEDASERLSRCVMTPKDYEEIAKLVLAVYESGYFQAVDQHKALLQQHGLAVNVVQGEVSNPDSVNATKIFNQ